MSNKVNLDEVSNEKAFEMGQMVGQQLNTVSEEAVLKINQILDQYGLKAKIFIQFINKETNEVVSN